MYTHLSQFYNQIFQHQEGMKSFIEPYIRKNQKALDIGCGTGRLTHDLHQLGMQALGIDLDPSMIEVAKKDFPFLDFKVKNMLDIQSLGHTFGLMTCFGNTLPHIFWHELKSFINICYDLLEEDGTLIIQLLNYLPILKHKPVALPLIETKDLTFKRLYTYMDDHIQFDTTLIYKDQIFSGTEKLFPYTMHDLCPLFEQAKFKVEAFGNLKGKPWQDTDYYLFLICKK